MSLRPYLLTLLVTLLAACSENAPDAPGAPAAGEPVLVVDGAQLWDGTGASPVQDAVVVIRGDRIEAAGPRSAVAVPPGSTVVDAKGKTIIPGIINLHGHIGLTKGIAQSQDNYNRESILAQLKVYARYGVTTVLSLGLDTEPMFEVRGPARPEESPRATVFTAGRGFTAKGGYPTLLAGLGGLPVEVDTVDEVKAAVQQLAARKVDVAKIWLDDHLKEYPVKIRPELYQAIIDEAHKQNIRVMAHVYYLEDAKGLAEAGIDGLAHSVRDKPVDDALIGALKKNGAFSLSTLSREESTFMYASPQSFLTDPFFLRGADPEAVKAIIDPAYAARVKGDKHFASYEPSFKMAQQNLKKLYDAGVKIGFGTDSGPPARFPGYFEHMELALMVDAGLTPAQALHIATLGSAQAFRLDSDYGSVEKGKRADLILLDADPLSDILNTRKIHSVWVGGRQVE